MRISVLAETCDIYIYVDICPCRASDCEDEEATTKLPTGGLRGGRLSSAILVPGDQADAPAGGDG